MLSFLFYYNGEFRELLPATYKEQKLRFYLCFTVILSPLNVNNIHALKKKEKEKNSLQKFIVSTPAQFLNHAKCQNKAISKHKMLAKNAYMTQEKEVFKNCNHIR